MTLPNNHAVIVDYLRTPFAKAAIPGSGKPPGRLADVDPVDLQVPLINAILDRTSVDPSDVSAVITGCVHQEGSQGLNIARHNVLHEDSKLPNSVAAYSVDDFCASSLKAIEVADGFLARNPEAVYICTGVQSMSQVPMGGFNPHLNPSVHSGNPIAFMDMPSTAENLAEKYEIGREEQDAFSVRSHKLHAQAAEDRCFKDEILPINGLDRDDGVRADSTVEGLARLRPVVKDISEGGSVTAASASQITDGASAVMLTSEANAIEKGMPIMARIIAFGESGCDPEIMGIGPVEATKSALAKAGLDMSDIGRIELNEAFAAQSLAVMKEWNNQDMAPDMDKVNVNGGAIAMGHPLGATGARLAGTLALELKKANQQYGLATLCIGGGQGMAMVIENPDFTPEV